MQTETAILSSTPKAIIISRQWVTPLLAGSFFLSAATGILLFFKIHLGIIKPVHEWLSWILVIASVLHLILNFAPLRKSLSPRLGKTIAVIFLLLTLCSLLPLGNQDDRHGHGEHRSQLQEHADKGKH